MKNLLISIFFCFGTYLGLLASTPKNYCLEVGDFNELRVVDNLNVVQKCVPDSAGMAVFTCNDEIASNIMFSNKNNKLKIEWNIDDTGSITGAPIITVYSNYIQLVENCGDSTVIVDSPAPGASFKARVIGNGTIEVKNVYATQTEGSLDTGKGCLKMNGTTRVAKLKNIGKGNIEAIELASEDCTVTLIGTGKVECQVSDKLTLKGSGSGSVIVKGDPQVKKRFIGNINIINQ